MLSIAPELFEKRPMHSERRRHVRHPTNVETQWVPITGTSPKSAIRIRDISRGGARVEVDHPVVAGQQVRIKLLSVMEARLVYVQPTPQGTWMTGCQFDSELSEEEMKVLVR
jgi:PilZ domain